MGRNQTKPMNTNTKELIRFRWWYSGRTPEGNSARFEGTGYAKDSRDACDNVEKMMRAKWPEIKWKHGREVEGEGDNRGVKFGPTVQMLRTKKQRIAKLEAEEASLRSKMVKSDGALIAAPANQNEL